METKNYEKAEKFFLKSLSLREELLGKEHLYTAQSYNHLSKLYMETENYGKAFAYVNKALEIRSKVLSSNHVDLIDSKNMLVIVTKLVNGNIPKKIQRNSPCFCGSGKKYKKCCGKNDKFLKKGIYIL